LTKKQLERVLGGEACSWGESVDWHNALQRMFPRASAVAERLWSQQGINDTDWALGRLMEFRCDVVRRGIPIGPLQPDWCELGPLFDSVFTYKRR